MPPPPNPCPQPSPTASEDSKRQKQRAHCRTGHPSLLLGGSVCYCRSPSFLLKLLLSYKVASSPHWLLPSHPCISEHRLPRKGCSLSISFQTISLKSRHRKLWAPLFWSLQIPNSGFGSCILLRAFQHFQWGQFIEDF